MGVAHLLLSFDSGDLGFEQRDEFLVGEVIFRTPAIGRYRRKGVPDLTNKGLVFVGRASNQGGKQCDNEGHDQP